MSGIGKKQSDNKPTNTIDTLIGANTVLKGDIEFSGGLRVDGKVKGNISASGSDNSSTLVLSEHGQIEGNVNVPHLVINGAINGNVQGAEGIELQGRASITGDVHYRMIEMALGATINGKLVRNDSEARGSVTPLKSVAESDNS